MADEKPAITPLGAINSELKRMTDQFKMVLPPHVTPDRFIRVTLTAIQQDPKLLNCDRASLFQELLKCAKDGLIPDGKEAAITPFGKGGRAQYMPMVAGILKIMHNAGMTRVGAHNVYENDEFRIWTDDDGDHVHFQPLIQGNRGNFLAAFAQGHTKNQGRFVTWMTAGEIDDVRRMSKAKDGPWDGAFWGEMSKKTILRRLGKIMPTTPDVDEVLTRDDDIYELPSASKQPPIEATRVESLEAPKADPIAPQAAQKEPAFDPPPAEAKKAPYNHAPGSTNPPPANEMGDSAKRGVVWSKMIPHLKKLGFTQAEADAEIIKLTGKPIAKLTLAELEQLEGVFMIRAEKVQA